MSFRRLSLVALVPVLLTACGDSDDSTPSNLDGATLDGNRSDSPSTTDGVAQDSAKPSDGALPDGALPDGSNLGDGSPDGAQGDADAAPVETVKIDEAKLRESAVAGEAVTGSLLPTLKGIISTFIDQGTDVQLNAADAANANRIDAHVNATVGHECGASTTHGVGTAEYTYTFPTCTLPNGVTTSGTIVVAVSKTADADAGTSALNVKFTFTNVQANGLTLNGTATVTTADLVSFPIDAAVNVTSLGALTFQGSGTTASAGGNVSANMTGSGTFTKAGGAVDGGSDAGAIAVDPGTDGWQCAAKSGGGYQVQGLTRTLKDCYPSAGTVAVAKDYTCTKGTLSKDVTTKTILTWGGTASVPAQVSAQVQTTIDGTSTTGTATPLSVAWTCPAPVVPDGGASDAPETAVDAAADTAAQADAAETDGATAD